MDMVTSHTPLRCYNYSVLYYRVIIKLVFDIPTFIHNTNNCYDTRVLIRDIEYQIIINWHHS